MQRRRVTRALISVSDKTGIVDLAQALGANDIEIIASDGTAQFLRDNGVKLRSVSEITGTPELLGGKVKTLHPIIHGAILANPENPDEVSQLTSLGPIDAVIVNLYPPPGFDIGGPALVRAGAKNAEYVSVITHPVQYQEFIASLSEGSSFGQRQEWARAALLMTAEYDLQLASQHGIALRYGENPHQSATLVSHSSLGVAGAQLIQGKPMSFNNYLDVDAAWKLSNLNPESVALVKHGIPSGIARASSAALSYLKAFSCDPISAFGGVVASSILVDAECAREVVKNFTEVIAAPDFTTEALTVFATKTNLRVLRISPATTSSHEMRAIDGGYLRQERDALNSNSDSASQWKLVAGKECDASQRADLEFAWSVASLARSNAVVIVKELSTIGIGAGNVNRLDAARNAAERAAHHSPSSLSGSVAASDAFFPFPDALHILIASGVSAVVQPGGSINDDDVIQAAKSAGITMYFSGIRHFSH
jgi:phosphoribosylaminoimidazolecarboxamide formyltransferase/IMP cyclohydrolase